MQAESLKEYEQIRSEMSDLKHCVTTYMGYVLGGSGVAVFGFTAIGAKGFSLAWSAMLLSLVISLVLVILFYKFTSHNRFAGYSKVLDAEVFVHPMENSKRAPGQSPRLIVAWEICIERLRVSDRRDQEYFAAMVDQADIQFANGTDKDRLKWLLRTYSGRDPPIDKRSIWRGMKQLGAALFGHVRTDSWAFPPYVASVFFVITLGLIVLAGYAVWPTLLDMINGQNDSYLLVSILLVLVLVQIWLWGRFCGKLYKLMTGSATVNGFFWRMLVLRAKYLKEFDNIVPSYVMITDLLDEASKNTTYTPAGTEQ